MTDRFDDAKRALEGVPAPDLWAEAERRAEGTSVVPLAPPASRSRRPVRWLAAAAAAVVAVGAIGLAVQDDEPNVDAGPAGEGSVVPFVPPTTDFLTKDGGCLLALDGEGPYTPVPDAESPWFAPDGQPPEQQVVTLELGDQQTAEIAVPGVVLIDLVGERVEDVELARGTGQVWFSSEFVQARWFTGSQEPCESFTVTVWGGTEDGNRHAAVALAEDVRLPSELEAAVNRSLEGTWEVAGARLDGEDLAAEPLELSFVDGEARWTTGCNDFSGRYELVTATTIHVPESTGTAFPCPYNPLAAAIESVMASDRISVSTTADSLVLTQLAFEGGGDGLTLHPVERSGAPHPTPGANPLAGTEWQLERSTIEGEPTAGDGLVFTFGDAEATWTDGCNDFGATYGYTAGVLTLASVVSTRVGCEATPTLEAVNSVMGAEQVAVELGGAAGSQYLGLRADGVELILRAPSAELAATLDGTEWTIVHLTDQGEPVPVPDDRPSSPRVTFSPERVGWTDGCNGYTADVTYGDGTMEIGQAVVAGVACEQHPGRDLINSVLLLPGEVSLDLSSSGLEVKRGDWGITLERS